MKTDASTLSNPVRLAVIVGSVRTDRFCPIPARWITDHARRRADLDVDVVDLADFDIPTDLGGNAVGQPVPDSVKALGKRIDEADAFIVVTPVYNRSFPASLKNAIDWFHSEWHLKPVGLMSYGGITGGLQAIDGLRSVFHEFHTVTLSDYIAFANVWEVFDHDGRPVDAEGTRALANDFLDQLTWWAQTLREGRLRRPYPYPKDTSDDDVAAA